MNKIIIILISIVSTLTSLAQISPKSEAELRAYFKNNISSLNPIEGVYDLNLEALSENAFVRFPSETTNRTILIYKDLSGLFKIYGDKNITIKQIGESDIYNFNDYFKKGNITESTRFVLKDGQYFEVKYQVPDRELRQALGRNYQAGFKVGYVWSCIKEYPTPQMYRESIARQKESVEEQVSNWSGTGFALKERYVVTNYHVIENAKKISIKGIQGDFNTSYNASIVGTDKINDLALLKILDTPFKGFGIIPYAISSSISEVGEEVYVLGYPLTSTMGDEIKLTTGIISSRTGFQGDVALYQISAPIQPGNSGGPLFDKKGNVIGIVSAKHSDAENVGYAIKSLYLKNLIESSVNSTIIPKNNTISSLSLTGKVKSEKNFVFFIECSK
ncbi:MAG: serine protease [Bacteroides sp.]|nr:serine protease [Bacteroides sp.]MCM1390052.1 serine protease [Bacteroides sp.]